jgi:hypothetical protein
VALQDLRLAAFHLAPGGIIAVDDYQHPDWQDVTTAVDTFIAESDFDVIADVNRWAEAGRKIYLGRRSASTLDSGSPFDADPGDPDETSRL